MKTPQIPSTTFLVILATLATLPNFAAAYIDPGSGSIILQFLLAAIFGSILFFKLLWQRVKDTMTRVFSSTSSSPQSPNVTTESDNE